MSDINQSFNELKTETEKYLIETDLKQITRAFEFAYRAHQNQTRRSGIPYILHPLATATTLAGYRLDTPTIMASLLHDVPEDTTFTLADIRHEFGDEVARLVDGVTKLSQVRLKRNWFQFYQGATHDNRGENFEAFERHVETLRKMFVAMSKDLRVVLIKLADRLHNMTTLDALPKEKQRRIAQETIQVYAPLANRLGIGSLKGKLEDLAFPYAHPEEFRWLNEAIREALKKREQFVEQFRRLLLKRLATEGIRAETHGRIKHFYSLWKKLLRYDKDLDKIYDLVATRVIVPTMEDCYRTLGIIHAAWRPLPGRIKDYIAIPKPNGYQSLHTTVFGPKGIIVEIQIRTPEMHHWAEFGIAAHWAYKDTPKPQLSKWRFRSRKALIQQSNFAWVKELAQLQNFSKDPAEWQQNLQIDFFSTRIFALTPHGDVLDLPIRATPVDFAFAVHSDLGRHCIGAKINGKIVPLSHQLESGDIVEILVSKRAAPKADWLKYAVTSKARTHIKKTIQTKN